MFSCEFCEIFKNTYFVEHLQTAAFVRSIYVLCPGEYRESFSSRKQSEIYKKKRADNFCDVSEQQLFFKISAYVKETRKTSFIC